MYTYTTLAADMNMTLQLLHVWSGVPTWMSQMETQPPEHNKEAK